MTDVRRIVSEHGRAVWILAAALVLNVLLYLLVVRPLAERAASGEQEAAQATQELVAARRTFAAASGTVTGKQQADQELERFYGDVLPPDFSAARRTLYPHVDQLARGANLETGRSNFDRSPGRLGPLQKLTMTITLSGEYTNVRRFLHELETAPEFLVLESVTVTQAEGSGRGLNVTAQVATYYRSADDGS